MELITYLLKVSACTVLFFAFYLLVLRRLTFFKINRFYLLFTLLLSFAIPTLKFTIEREVAEIPTVYTPIEALSNEIEVAQQPLSKQLDFAPAVEEDFDWYSPLTYLYFGIVGCLLSIAIWRILQLVKYTKNGAERINGLKIVPKTAGFTNCSFFNYVFIDNESLTSAELQVLLKHEQVHAKQLHSIDKVLLIIIKAFLWFNPVVYLYDKALEQAHEYEADEATSQSFGTEQYANLLLRLAIAKSEMPLVHNFVKSPIKERIKMLFNSKSKNMKKMMYLLALPIGLGLLWGFTVKVVNVSNPPKVTKEKLVAINKVPLSKHLWGKSLKGKVKSILKTEVGEILNFKYGETTVEIYNHALGKVKVGDELLVTISGTVNDITVTDKKGNFIRKLEKPCYLMSELSRLDGTILYQIKTPAIKADSLHTEASNLNAQDTIKTQKQKNLERKREFEAFRKSPEYAKKVQEMKDVNGKTFTGVVGDDYDNGRGIFGKGKLFTVGNTVYILEKGFAKQDIFKSIAKNDKIEVKVDYSSFNKDIPYLMVAPKTITKDGKLLYTAPARPTPKQYAFLYEANKARYAWSVIKAIDKNSDGTIKKIVLNDNGFTINLNVAAQKFKSKDFKVGNSVIVKFFGEKLVAKNTYTTDKMIVLYSWPKKYELRNNTLYNRFYEIDGTQKIAENNKSSSKEIGSSVKPKLLKSTSLTVDTKSDIVYARNVIMQIGGNQLQADEIIWDKINETITSKNASITSKAGIISSESIIYDLKKGTYKAIQAKGDIVKVKNEISYSAKDSTKFDRLNQIVYLYGKAEVSTKDNSFQGSSIAFNKKTNTIKVNGASIYDKKLKTMVKADSMYMNINTLKGVLFGVTTSTSK
ncbi:hypothetical protein FA048_01165 [Pedobacter polaris]|uniref:Peptidase M56 domain-containing protein n=1 Tax=Pedobacter polaris TaxID=2571273 RepID=A0A4U1CVT4_9SPHI|nr:M56 family metallopeptidase [Pedobacter polaris]TKC12260.1 hypothetical protein FA048_01165 [Pedobacter polaris]